MRAAIDIGSNSVQMLAGEVKNGFIVPCYTALETTRLGDMESAGFLSAARVEDTLKVLGDLVGFLHSKGITEIKAVATSAVRDAQNKERLLSRSPVNITVLAGQDEASLTFAGVKPLFLQDDYLMMDIGGGSTELMMRQKDDLKVISLDLGAVRAQTLGWDRRHIKDFVKQAALFDDVGSEDFKAVGIGGTCTTVAALLQDLAEYEREKVHGYIASYQDIENLWQLLSKLPREKRSIFSPLLSHRGLIICEGMAILLTILEFYQLSEIVISDAGILDGILLNWTKIP
ncbi:MAG: hypothetical protein ACOX05_00900 [Bacillota bacterium]|jgi:exopolyphosphatase/guanosine-5'-triphosphate,3'-diphosphate pyrophosphatase